MAARLRHWHGMCSRGAAPRAGQHCGSMGQRAAGAATPGPSTLAEAHELPRLNAGSTAQGDWDAAVRGPQAATQSPAGK